MYCPDAEQEVKRLRRSVTTLTDELQAKQAQIDRYEPVISFLGQLVELWMMRPDTLPENNKELCRLYRKAKESEKE